MLYGSRSSFAAHEHGLAGGPHLFAVADVDDLQGSGEVDRRAEVDPEARLPKRPPEADGLAEQPPAVDLPRGHGPRPMAAPPSQPQLASAADVPDVLLVLEDDAEGLVDDLRAQLRRAEREQRIGPVERLGDAGDLREVDAAQPMHERHDPTGEALGRVRHAGEHDLELLGLGRVVDPVIQAAALERVVDLAGPVRGEDHARRPLGPDRADLGHGDLEVREDLEQVRLELLVGAVDLVDEEDRRDAVPRLEGLEQRALDQELGPEDVVRGRRLRGPAAPRAAGSRASGAGSSTRRPPC